VRSDEIRRRFLDYFQRQDHLIMPGSSLIPHDDPSVLLTTAGMQQFKQYFLGTANPPHPRIATVQKCVRTDDIEEVGDRSHLTFFEMLGNFSFGDYFKQEAITFAWELVTKEFPFDRATMWVTVFGGAEDLGPDRESEEVWRSLGVPADRIVRIPGWKANWWGPTGDSGPCGPCTEIHLEVLPNTDRHACTGPTCSCGRYVEIWNLVFNQYFSRVPNAKLTATALTPLPRTGVDTGAGLERWAVALQGVPTVYETDLFLPMVERASTLIGKPYGQDETTDRAIRIVCEHTRAAVFLIGDGVLPGNDGRAYVLRRLVRRAMRYAYLLGRREPLLAEIGKTVLTVMGAAYPELIRREQLILRILAQEEERFLRNLTHGMPILTTLLDRLAATGQRTLPGSEAFLLYDSYGFPLELTREIASGRGVNVDEAGFQTALKEQQERSRAAGQPFAVSQDLPLGFTQVTFTGYETLQDRGTILALQRGTEWVSRLEAGEEGLVIVDRTPFYAESGGQVGDQGWIITRTGLFRVTHTLSPQAGLIVHRGKVTEGYLEVAWEANLEVDAEPRAGAARNHTATHLLHAALRTVLGEHVHQSGSLVAPDHLRFDFTHPEMLTDDQREEVERLVNQHILADLPVQVDLMETSQAIAAGALALFGEKYGETVRVISLDNFSKELCGGTHVRHTGEIGLFHITSESSIGAGLRRIEAVTGKGSVRHVQQQTRLVHNLARLLEAPPQELAQRAQQLLQELAQQRRRIEQLERNQARLQSDRLLANAEHVNGASLVVATVEVPNMELFRELGDMLKERLGGPAVLLLGTVLQGRPQFLVMVTKDLVQQGLHAGQLVREIGKAAGGGGGGSPETAQAGGRDVGKLEEALRTGALLIRQALEKTRR